MRRNLLFILVFTCALASACWQSGGDNANSATDVTSESIAAITDADQALALGNQLFENNETERAIEAYLRATELNPDLAEAWFQLGIAYALIEKEQELRAESDVNATDDNGQKTERTNSEKAFRKAIDAYKKILDQRPDDHAALFDLGRAYNKLNQDEESLKALRQAVKLNPENSEYQTELGAILIKLAQYREAIPPLKKALELDPENSRAADLLEDAEAGRARVDYVPPKKDGNSNANANANANVDSNANSNSAAAKPTPAARSTPRPEPREKPTQRPELN